MSTLADGQLVLIIEDNATNLKLARDLLRYHGFRTIEAVDAETGVRMASESAPDVVLMDIELPGMDGVTALERLRADPATAALVVVAFTASVMPVDRDRFSRAGFAGIIVKPIDTTVFPAQVLAYCSDAEVGE
ncbi:MAG: response regulator [Candidatus Dormiibacterota bacterium]